LDSSYQKCVKATRESQLQQQSTEKTPACAIAFTPSRITSFFQPETPSLNSLLTKCSICALADSVGREISLVFLPQMWMSVFAGVDQFGFDLSLFVKIPSLVFLPQISTDERG